MIGLAVALGYSLMAPASQAQIGNGINDPFTFYYGYYLPHQAAIAAQPSPMDTINAATAARQFTAPVNRSGVFDPVSPFGAEDQELFGPQGAGGGGGKIASLSRPGMTSNARGTGPALYYNRTARYYPSLRVGRYANHNLAPATRRGGGGYGGGGMPSATPSLPSMNPSPY